eukprot:TRINITY_DN15849_c0_g1_i1.p1 TRINITY_DN15849_c0_g1~~TRINITY_DN15849_c0_g1_i1.p1  ORF type:complete len:431 (+),score=122.76 TRINITY_DN15849_c0_g1_i1:63-1355(+)
MPPSAEAGGVVYKELYEEAKAAARASSRRAGELEVALRDLGEKYSRAKERVRELAAALRASREQGRLGAPAGTSADDASSVLHVEDAALAVRNAVECAAALASESEGQPRRQRAAAVSRLDAELRRCEQAVAQLRPQGPAHEPCAAAARRLLGDLRGAAERHREQAAADARRADALQRELTTLRRDSAAAASQSRARARCVEQEHAAELAALRGQLQAERGRHDTDLAAYRRAAEQSDRALRACRAELEALRGGEQAQGPAEEELQRYRRAARAARQEAALRAREAAALRKLLRRHAQTCATLGGHPAGALSAMTQQPPPAPAPTEPAASAERWRSRSAPPPSPQRPRFSGGPLPAAPRPAAELAAAPTRLAASRGALQPVGGSVFRDSSSSGRDAAEGSAEHGEPSGTLQSELRQLECDIAELQRSLTV